MKNKQIVIFVLIFTCLQALQANQVPTEQDRQNFKNIEKELNFMEKKQNEQNIEKQLEQAEKRYKPQTTKKKGTQNLTKKKYFFKTIRFSNYKSEIPTEISAILSKYTKRWISASEIYEIIEKTTNYFISKGYSTSVVIIDKLNTKKQYLILKINFGYVNNIYINDKPHTARAWTAIPLKKNSLFNIFALDQGVENISNASYFAEMNIKPSDKHDGYSDIYIYEKHDSMNIGVDIDNSADKDRGSFRGSVYYIGNNLFGISDQLYLLLSHRFLKNKRDKENAYIGSYTIPIGYYKIMYQAQFSDVENTINGNYGNYLNANQTIKHKLSFKRAVYRDTNTKATIYVTMALKDVFNKINDSLIEANSGRYTNITLGFEILEYLSQGSLFFNLEHQSGVPFFGARQDSQNSIYRVNFEKINFNLFYNQYVFRNQYLGVLFKMNAAGSYSKDTLLYADKFFVGDEYTVRGFKESSAAWDWGFYINNTISLKFNTKNIYLNFEPFIGLDFGYGRDYELEKNDLLIGIAFGVKYTLENLSISFAISKDLHKGRGMPKESIPMYFRASVSI